jgi:hypothetical protein
MPDRGAAKRLDTDEALRQAALDLFAWRDTFQYPLGKVVMGLRSFVKTVRPELQADGAKLPVGQRLKREPQIIRKLVRIPKMRMSRMGDIGGCRAVMPGGAPEVARVLDRITDQWEVSGKIQDYVTCPQSTGYRAIHVIVKRDDRRIEVQLRTPRQQEWAETVERTGLRLRQDLKGGRGDPALLRYFELAAFGLALEESGEQTDEAFVTEFAEVRERVRHFFRIQPTSD